MKIAIYMIYVKEKKMRSYYHQIRMKNILTLIEPTKREHTSHYKYIKKNLTLKNSYWNNFNLFYAKSIKNNTYINFHYRN